MTISEKALCAALLGAMATPVGMVILPASAQEAAVRFELPAQDLATTLRKLARQAGREILFADEDVRGLRAPAVRGSLTLKQAMQLAIRGRSLIVEDQAGALVVRVRPQAAEADATEITVTGTRIRGANGPSPVIVMTRRQLEEQGLPDMASISRIIPQNFTGGQNPGVAGGGDQGGYNNINNATTLNLRGLGSDATLTLINGHRLPYDGVNQGVDISIIPLAALDRVEVIADGASALYGSDAVGGVANLLLRRDYDGFQTSARVGASTDGGNVQQQYSGVGGARWTGGGFMAALDYSKATPITANQRDYTRGLDRSQMIAASNRQVSGVLAGHQDLADWVSLEIDAQLADRRGRKANAFSTTASASYFGQINLPVVRSYAVTPSLHLKPGGGWEATLQATQGESSTVSTAMRYTFGTLLVGRTAYDDDLTNFEASAESHEPFVFPCAILEEGDDAAAVEASLIENMARLDPDEVTRWETFVRLVREGQSPEEIADTFALPVLAVRRTLALGNLLPRIRDLYRHEKIDAATVRHLTLASKARQKDWLVLWDAPDTHCPTGWQLRGWLFGGQAICASYALFDVDATGLALVADLFNEQRYVADADAFWTAQNAAIEQRRTAYLEAGWTGVEIVGPAEQFQQWEYEKAPKRKGGRVYIDVRASGEVVFHEGYLTRKEARRIERGEAPASDQSKPVRPEITGPMQTYLDLHRHAAVRAALLSRPKVALRLMVAHVIAGSHLWRVDPEPQQARNGVTAESVETCRGETLFDAKRRTVLATLGFDPETPTIGKGRVEGAEGDRLTAIFHALLDLPDRVVMDTVAVLIGETLAAGSPAVEAVGLELGVDMARWWQADTAFFELVRDREVLTCIVAEVAGNIVANANTGEKTATLKKIVTDHLGGVGGRTKVEHWVPRWMAFPPSAYTTRGGVGTVVAYAKAEAARPAPVPEPVPEPQPEPLAA